MRKIYIWALVLSVFIVFSSCVDEKKNDSYRIGVSQCSSGMWRDKQNNEMQRELLQHDGVTMELVCAEDNADKQIKDIQHFIDEKVDAILVSPSQEEPLTPIISKAYDAGIPVILFDRRINGNKYTAFVGGDNTSVGKALATFAINNLKKSPQPIKNGNLAAQGNVVELMGSMSSSPAKLRHDGFMQTIANYPDIHVIASIDCDWDAKIAVQKTDSLLKKNPNIEVIATHNDWMAYEVKKAMDKAHPDIKIKYIGTDGFGSLDYGLVAVSRGQIDATAIYPTGGDIVMRTAIDILNGKPVQRETLIPSHIVSNPNDATFILSLNNELLKETSNVIDLKEKIIFFDNELKLERSFLIVSVTLLIVFIGLVITFYRLYSLKKRTSSQLLAQSTELREQRDQLIVMQRELEQATNAKLVFFTNISHDFRTPLTLISAPLERIQKYIRSWHLDDTTTKSTLEVAQSTMVDMRHLLHISQRNVKVLLDLVNQILDFRKIENDKMELHLEPVNLLVPLKQWYESFEKIATQKGIKMEINVEGKDWNVICDQKRIERMVYNLIGNAMKFTPAGGTIKLLCSNETPADKEKGSLNRGNVSIGVSDTGIGISEENIQRIFERFYQIEGSSQEGTGIGLALVKKLVELMHGDIDIKSNTDTAIGPTGTTITLTLPLKNADSIDTEPERLTTSKPQSFTTLQPPQPVAPVYIEIPESETRQVVLVIDDNDDIRNFLTAILSERYRVITAGDGKQGLTVAHDTVPDIIICDVMMPVMDGLECCHQLKTNTVTSHIPILMLTACSLDEQRVKGLTEGAEAYIAKPFSIDVLMAQIETLLKNRTIIRDYYGKSKTTKAVATVKPAQPVTAGKSLSSLTSNLSKYDNEFIDHLKAAIEKRYTDDNFNVEELADMVCLGRTQLYRKCKALIGESPVELIRNTRLLKAQKLLQEGTMPIAEVAKAVGIPDPSYFAKCYKTYFGELPRYAK